MRVDLLLQHLDIGITEQQLLFIVFIPQSLYIGFHFVKADMQLPDLIGTETVIVVSGVLRIRESLSEAADLLYQKIQMCSILRRSNSARNRAIITTTAENRIIRIRTVWIAEKSGS